MKLAGPRAGVAVSLLWAQLAESTGILFHLHVVNAARAAVFPLALPAGVRLRSTRASMEGGNGSCDPFSSVIPSAL